MIYFFEIHSDLPREGPGNYGSTLNAFHLLKDLPENPKILDIGCGPGQQTLHLAEMSDATITAVDNHQPFLDDLKKKIKLSEFANRIIVQNDDMQHLDFTPESFDVIWAEGAIYILGFEKGLMEWKRFLKPNGYVAVTEITWLKDTIPEGLKDYWDEAYPAMRNIEGNLQIINKCGYELIGHFTLPPSAWWDDYYDPIEQKLFDLRIKYKNDKKVMEVLKSEQDEIHMYRKYSDYYGYVFYVMQKKL